MIRLTEPVRTILALLSIFLIGGVAGVALDRTLLIPHHAGAAVTHARHGVVQHHNEVFAELSAELELSADQSARVREIFAAHQGDIETAWSQIHANLQRAMQEATAEIEAVLDSAQVKRLHAWIAKRHARTPRHAPGGGH